MPRCKLCKQKFEVRVFLQKHCIENTECINAELEYKKDIANNQRSKAWNKKKKVLAPLVYPKKFKGYLQDEINKLARMIDNLFGFRCIDCDKDYGKQQDGGHFKSVGSNASLRFNLHNIHSQTSQCNRNGHGSGMERAYHQGLITRYGEDYAAYVDAELQVKYKHIGLKDNEIQEKLTIVRKLVREFDSFELENSIQARSMFNDIIGIYK